MLYHNPTDEEQTWGNRSVILQKNSKKTLDGTNEPRGSFQGNKNKMDTYTHNQKEEVEMSEMRKASLENFWLAGCIAE